MSTAAVLSARSDLAAEIEDLRQKFNALRSAQMRVTLAAIGQSSYLGQAVSIVATFTRSDSMPVPGVTVTLFTTWGVLRGGDDLIEGTSVAAVTGADGSVRVTLRPAVSLDNNEDQDALETMLSQLEPASASPADAQSALLSLAQQYRWEANQGFRNAVDTYFSEFGRRIPQDGAVRDYTVAWPLIPAAVIAFAAGTDAGSSPAAAVVSVRVRNWLGPWYQAYQNLAASQIQLNQDLSRVKANAGTASGIVAGAFGRAAVAAGGEFGEIGARVAHQVTQKAVGDFLDSGIADLPAATRVAVSPVLSVLSSGPESAASGFGVVAALGQTRVAAVATAGTVAGKVDRTEFQSAIATKANTADVTGLQQIVATKVDSTAFAAFQKDTTTGLATKLNANDFQTFRKTVDERLGTVVGRAEVQSMVAALRQSIAVKADVTALESTQKLVTAMQGRFIR